MLCSLQTVVVTQNQVASHLPEHFPEPQQFLPERWLHKAPPAHPFVVLPFSHGPRSCIGRRMAEQNLQTVILQVRSCTNVNMATCTVHNVLSRASVVHHNKNISWLQSYTLGDVRIFWWSNVFNRWQATCGSYYLSGKSSYLLTAVV